jgi:hypothetical protein
MELHYRRDWGVLEVTLKRGKVASKVTNNAFRYSSSTLRCLFTLNLVRQAKIKSSMKGK